MKTDNRHSDDAPLNALLQEWQPKSSLPPGFQGQVWRRIERAETAPIPTVTFARLLATWLATRLSRPAFAIAYVSMLLIIGAGVGWSHARQESVHVTNELAARYAHAVDPYQSTP